MSTDISRVYAFLAKQGDWVNEADKNGDGTVIKSEFRDFMEENFEWDGETTDAGKNDLINNFWKTIDTNQSGKVSGTRLKNKNALDKKEITAMNNRIQMYEILNQYTASLTAPSVVGDGANWKKSVSQGLGALVEPYIKNGGKPEQLQAYLDEKAASIKAKATADYCAQEYLAEVMGDIAREYGYTYGDDKTLQGMINRYIQNLPAEADDGEIEQTVQGIIDAYMATAGLNEDSAEDLGEFGYTPTANSPLNDLQKSIIQSKLEKALASETDFEEYKSMFSEAAKGYIETLKFGNFVSVNEDTISQFKTSKQYKGVLKAIDTQKVFDSEELKSAINTAIGESFAVRISGLMKGEIPAYDELVSSAMSKAQFGEFDSNGTLDTQKLINWIISEVKKNIADYYPNGFGGMPIEELNAMYDALAASAKENQDAAKMKEAAVSYCKAVSAKGAKLAELVNEIFGDNYASVINKMTTGEIENKMEELKINVLEIGDATKFEVSNWNGLPEDNLVMYPGYSQKFNISAEVDTKGHAAPNITYSLLSASGCSATCSIYGELNITAGSAEGQMSVKVAVMADGVQIGTKTIPLKCEITGTGLVNSIGDESWGGASSNLEVYGCPGVNNGTQVTSASFADLYNNNAVIQLHTKSGTDGDWNQFKDSGIVISRINDLLNLIGNAMASKGIDRSRLDAAIKIVQKQFCYTNNWSAHKDRFKGGRAEFCSSRIQSGQYPSNTVVKQHDDIKAKGDKIVYMVSFKGLVDAVINALKQV